MASPYTDSSVEAHAPHADDPALGQPMVGRLVTHLLGVYERSASFRAPGPWKRSVIVRVATAFPDAFESDRGDVLEDLVSACRALERAGAARVVWERGYASNQPKEVRLTADVLPRARDIGRRHGYAFLDELLDRVAHDVERVRAEAPTGASDPMPEWMVGHIEAVLEGLRTADLTPLRVSREKLPSAARDAVDGLRAAAAIAAGASGWERAVSQGIFADTKRLEEIRARVAGVLAAADPQWAGDGAPMDAGHLLAAYGVRRQPPTITCAGRAVVRREESVLQIRDFQPHVILPAAWGQALSEGLAREAPRVVTLVENQQAFLAYVEERGGPDGLAEDHEVAVYTGGFPPPALVSVLEAVGRALPSASFRHWGDADVGGLRIWRHLREGVGRPVAFFRTVPEWVREAARFGHPISAGERVELERMKVAFAASADAARGAGGPSEDWEQAAAVAATILAVGAKIEQEGYHLV